MLTSNIRIENGGTDVATGTKYALRWHGIESLKQENSDPTNGCHFIGLCGYKAYDNLYYEIC